MPKLPALQNYRFAPRAGEFYIDYDTVVLEPTTDAPTGKVMLGVHGQLVGIADERAQMGLDQVFVLRRNVGVGGSVSGNGAWPLVAISHQMVVRDTPWVRWTGTLDELRGQQQQAGMSRAGGLDALDALIPR
jgi:hypothetical protein